MIRNIFRRILSVASALAIVFTAYPPVIFADNGGLCPHHPEHSAECGYVEGMSPCNFVCEICDPPEVSDSPEPSDPPAPEVTTAPEEQPPVTTAPEPEPVETVTTATAPEESETLPNEPLPEPNFSPLALNGEHVAHDEITDWQAWSDPNSLPSSAGNYYLTTNVTLSTSWEVPAGGVNLCLNGNQISISNYHSSIQINTGSSLTVYDCQNVGQIKNENTDTVYIVGGQFNLKGGNVICTDYTAAAINVYYSGVVTIDGGTVQSDADAIKLSYSSNAMVLKGSVIGKNHGISVGSDCTVTIRGGYIEGTKQYAVNATYGKIILSGNPQLKGRPNYWAGGELSIRENPITIDQPLFGGPFSVEKDGGGIFATGDYAVQSRNCFIPAYESEYIIVENGDQLELVKPTPQTHNDLTFEPWISGDSLPTDPGNYYLTTDVTPTGDWEVPGEVNLCLNSKKITLEDYQIQVSTGDELTIYDCDQDDDAVQVSSNNNTINIDGNGTFTLNGGSLIGSDQAIYSDSESAVITINGGIASGMQKAVCAKNVTITGGSILGVWDTGIDETTSLTLSGNPMILGGSGKPDIYINHEHPMTVSNLTNEEPYGVAMDTPGVFATVEGGSAEDYVDNFTSKDNKYAVVADGDSLKLVEVHRHADGEEFLPWDGIFDLTEGNYYLAEDAVIGANVRIEGDVTLCLNGKTLNCDDDMLKITSGNSLAVCDCSNDKSGKISSTKDKNGYIYVDGGKFTLESGTIGNQTLSNGTMVVQNGGSATINDGTVVSKNQTIIVYGSASSVTVNDGEIKGGSGDMSFGIASSGGNISIFGGKITSDGDSAVFFMDQGEDIEYKGGTLELSGNPEIKGVGADIQLSETSTLTIAEPLTGGPYVLDGVKDRVFATGDGAVASIDCFKLTDDLIAQGYVIVAENGELKAVVKHEHEDGTNFETKWDKENELPTEPGSYFLTKDVTLSANWDVSSDITLCLNGHKIDCGEDYYYIDVKPGGSLTVYDCQNGEGIRGYGSQTVNVDGGKFTLESGIVSGSAYVIKAIENSTVTINGGELNGYYAGIESNGEVIIRGGQITNRDNGPGSYAVDIMKGGHLTLSGNPKFSETKTDISLSSTDKIEFDGELETTEPIKIDVALKNQAFTIGAGENGVKAEQFEYAGSDDYEVQKVGSELWLVPKGAHVHEDDGTIFLPWDGTTKLTAGNYYLADNVELKDIGSQNITGDVTLCLNGKTLSCVIAGYNVFGTLTICDCSAGEIGKIIDLSIGVMRDGHFTLKSGQIISTKNQMYALHLEGDGFATIAGGTVKGYGGIDGLYDSTITITGGNITGTDREGIITYGKLIISGGTIKSENTRAIYTLSDELQLSNDPVIEGSNVDIYLYANSILIDQPLTGGPYVIDGVADRTFATGDGAAASIDRFKLTDDLINAGYEIAIDGDALVARLKTYTIKYESGEGSDISGKLFTETKTHGKNITISDKKFTRPGYTQIGWSTEQGASEVKYAFGADYTENANLTLYPVWEQNEIHFYKDGVEIHNLSLKVGESAEISVKITPENAVCGTVQWTAQSGISIDSGTGYTVTVKGDSAGKFELKATTDGGQTAKTLTVNVTRFNSTVTAENKTVTYGENVTITATVEKAATNGISLMSLYDNKVTLRLGDKELGTAEIDGDTATLTIPATRANGFAIGENTVTLEYSGSGALENVEGSVTVTVKPKTLTATITGTTAKTYDGTASADDLGLELKLTGVVDDDDVTATAEFAYDSASAGERKISAEKAALTGEHAGYYELSAPIPTVSGKISPLAVELVWEGDEFVYDGTSHEVTAAVENVVGDDEIKLTYTENTATNAGKYTAKVTDLGNENYTLTGATGIEHKWKITALSLANAQIEIVGSYTYNGEIQTPEFIVTLGGKVLSADKDYTVTYSGDVIDAGKYTVTLTGTGNYSGNASAEFEIAPKSLTANISGTLNKVYDGTANVSNDVKIALTGVVEGDIVTATAEISYDSENAGVRKIVAKNIGLSGEDAKNYTLSSNQNEISGSIAPAPITLSNTEFIYGGETKTIIQVSGIGETVTATLTAFSSNVGEYEYSEAAKENSYTVELSSENYAVSKAGTLTIKSLVVVLEWHDGEFTYDGNAHEVTATVKNAVSGDKFEIEYTDNTATAAGDYTAKVTTLGNANYILSGAHEYEWKIAPRVAEIEWVGDEFTYDGKSHTVTATVKNAVGGDKFEIEYTGNTATEAGNYIAKVTNLGNTNYTLSGATGIEHEWKITTLSLADAQIEIVGTYTYNGEIQIPQIRVTLGGKELSADDYTLEYSGEVKDAGEYTVTLTGIGNYSGSASTEFEIAPKPLTASIFGTLSKVYNGTTDVNDDVKIALSGVVKDDDVTATAEISYDSANAGARKIAAKNITLSGKDAKNYTLSSKQAEASGSISPAPIDLPNTECNYSGEAKTVIQVSGIGETVTATLTAFSSNACEYEYSETAKEGCYTIELSSDNYKVQSAGTLTIDPLVAVIEWHGGEFTYDGTVHGVTAKVKNAVADDKFEIAYTDNAATEAGDYTAKVTNLGNANYTLSGATGVEHKWKIAPRVAEIEWIGSEFTYDGKSHTITATVENAVGDDEFELTYSGNTATNTGDYTAKVIALGNANYTLEGANEHKWKIAPRVAVIEWVGDEFTYNGKSHTITATVKNAVTGDKFEIAYTGNTATEAGNYTAKVTALGNANYTLEGANEHKWKITPRVAEIEWVGNEFTYDGNSHTVTATVKNAVAGDKLEIEYTGNTATNAGDYIAKVTALGNENYTLNGATGIEHEWKITTLSLADAQVEIVGTYTYNGEVQTPEIRVTLGGKELLSGKDYTLEYSGEVKNADTYTVTLTGTGNYSGSAKSEFEIAPKPLTASISGTLSKVYDGTTDVNDDVKIALSGIVKDDEVTATAEISYDSADVGTRKIAAKNISLGGEAAKNYTLASKQAEISGSITPAPITLPDSNFIYGGEAKTVIQVSGINETVTATLTAFSSDADEYEYSEVAKEGGYTVKLSSDNYAVSKAGLLTIKPLVAVLEWQSGEFTYDGTVHEVTATVKNAVSGDKFNITYTGNTAIASGDYTAKVTALGNSNYTLEGSNEYKWKIAPRVAEIEWVGDEFTYDGKSHTVTATVKNAVDGDKFNITYIDNTETEAGDYTAKVIALGNANYTLEGVNEYKWMIAPRVAVIEWVSNEFTYDGELHEVTATVKNAVGDGEFELTYTGNTATKAGDYTAKVTALGNENYTLSGATGIEHKWKITAASQAAPEVKIDFINETLSTDETMEFSVDGETWQDCAAAMNVAKTGWNGSAMTVKIRYKKDIDHIEGEIQNLVIPARRAAPDISETAVSKSQTEISIAEIPGCEYSLDGATWQDSGVFGELDKGETYEIFVRYKATSSAFASFVTSKTVVTSSTADGTTELLPGETVTAGDGSIKNLGGEIIIDDGMGNVTTVTLPEGGLVEVDEQGCVTIPDGGEVAVGDNPAVSLPDGGKVEPDGTVMADEVKIGDTDVKGEDVTIAPDGKITVPGEGSVKVGDNPEIILPTGGTVEPDGTVTADEVKVVDTDVKGNDVTVTPDGNITVPGEGQVKVGNNPEIILPTGGTVEPDGTVIADEVKIGDTDVKGEDVTVAPDGIITLPEGGKVSVDGEPEKIVPAGTTVINGKINAPAIAEPADGSESLGDDIILKIEPADDRLETADHENLKDVANAIVREVYDIELLKNGVEVQPDKSIKLTVSADVSGAKMKVFMLNNDGKFTEMNAEFDTENGTFCVVTDSLGIFILASEEGQISAEVVASGGAPEVEIGDDDKKALEEEVFTDEDEAAIENGDNVKVVMNVDGVSEEDVSADDIAEIEAFLDDLEGCEVAEYADITLTKITEDGVTGDEIRSEAISEINNPIKLVIDIPEALHKVGRIFSVIRLHDGKAELLNDTDQSDETVTILTDKFSLYVLIYRDPASQPSHVHSFTAWINVGEAGHLARCAVCGEVMSLMPHTMLNGVCTACGYSAIFSQPFDESDVIEIEVPTEGMIVNEKVVEF